MYFFNTAYLLCKKCVFFLNSKLFTRRQISCAWKVVALRATLIHMDDYYDLDSILVGEEVCN